VIGLELSFFLIGIVLAGLLSAAGLPDSVLQWLAAVLLVAFALTMLVPVIHERFQALVSRVTAPLTSNRPRNNGFTGGLIAGAPLGLIWAPCAGPILAGITVAGATTRFSGRIVTTMVAYGLGMLGPLLLLALGGRKLSTFLREKLGGGRRVEIGMAIVLLVTAAMIGFGWVNRVNTFLAESINLTSTPTASLEQEALASGNAIDVGEGERVRLSDDELQSNGYPELEKLADYGPAPGLAGISNWFNSEALTMGELRGKVVLIDFWTYSCINCIRTFPYLKQWYADYKDDGFVLLGVHTPEFTFEKDPNNVADAIKDFGIEYPVALDPDYGTWDNYYNRYWPAHYLIDRDGVLRSVHYGEGAYDRTENEIRHLLSLPPSSDETADEDVFQPRTPETYLGYVRADRFAGSVDGRFGFVMDQPARYETPPELPVHWWTYDGNWTVKHEMAETGGDAAIELHYLARDVHIVAGPGPTGQAGVLTIEDGNQTRTITIDEHRLYTLRSGDQHEETMRLEFTEGLEVYSFTFG
jgi:cytochrome c biogenesis protein CcdA/thiol-disulfide isomerase/thioredoxin